MQSVPKRGYLLLIQSIDYKIWKYLLNGQVSGRSNVHNCYQLLERHPFSGRCDSAGELLHTPYADSNFHGHRPAVYTTRNTLSLIGRLEQIWLSPAYLENVRLNPSSPVLLTRNGPLRIIDTYCCFRWIKKSWLSKASYSHRFKVWEKAEVVRIWPTDTSSHCFTLCYSFLLKKIVGP